MTFRDLTDSLRRSLAEIVRQNARIASGRRINAPSDDPAGAAAALGYRLDIDAMAQYRRNIDEAAGFLSFTDAALGSAAEALVRGKELALAGATGTAGAGGRAAMGREARQLADQLAAVANGRFGGRAVFAGFATDGIAFDAAYAYLGDAGVARVPIDRGVSIALNVPGEAAFGTPLSAEKTAVISGGRIVHYIPSGRGVVVEIRASDDATVLDSFGFDNVMQLTALLAGALESDDPVRVEALVEPLGNALDRAADVRAEVGARLARLEDQSKRLEDGIFSAREALSRTEDADVSEAAAGIARADAALQALRTSSARIVSQSLLDFLE